MAVLFFWRAIVVEGSPGHASMYLHFRGKNRVYVSWYPAGNGKDFQTNAVLGQDKCMPGKAYESMKVEIAEQHDRLPPDIAVEISSFNERVMETAWQRFKAEPYCLKNRNCSSVIYYLLRQGGTPPAQEVFKWRKSHEEQTGEPILWAEPDQVASKLHGQLKDTITPMRLFNYANALSQKLKLKE